MQDFVVTALSVHLPNILRWAGGVARLLRQHNIGLASKGTGSATTDALTLADLSLQELIVAALRDSDPIFRHCRIDAEESTGDLAVFPSDAPLTIGIDPIDGTRKYRDFVGDGYSVMLHLRSKDRVIYSLVYIPEQSGHGWWVEAREGRVVRGPDDPSRPALDVLRSLPEVDLAAPATSKSVYVNGFSHRNAEVASRVTALGITGVTSDQLAGCTYDLLASGQLSGALVHSPNVYDFPVTSHLTQLFGGKAVFVTTGREVDFHEIWLDPKADMLRIPGIVACSRDSADLDQLCNLARKWHPDRYFEGDGLQG